MSSIYIEPGRSNSASEDNGHWKIMFEENGKSRHLNDGTSRDDAEVKAQRAAAKRGVPFEGGTAAQPTDDSEIVHPPKKHYLDPNPRPRGAPKVGTMIQANYASGGKWEGEVVGYLSDQFVIEFMAPTQRIVNMKDNWREL